MRWFVLLVLVVITGCAERMFTDLGNGTGVPAQSVKAYAREHGVTEAQARKAMLADTEAQTRQSAK